MWWLGRRLQGCSQEEVDRRVAEEPADKHTVKKECKHTIQYCSISTVMLIRPVFAGRGIPRGSPGGKGQGSKQGRAAYPLTVGRSRGHSSRASSRQGTESGTSAREETLPLSLGVSSRDLFALDAPGL